MSAKPAEANNRDAIAAMGDIVEQFSGKTREDLSLMDVMALAEAMTHSAHNFFDTLDSTIYAEFKDISTHIADMRTEIGALRPNDIKNGRIPDAGHELDAIVETTEAATETIMTSAEAMMAADISDPEAYQAEINDHVIKIMEACSFQDLTGQRISKVVETLNFIEARISRFSSAIGAMDGDPELSEEEQREAKRREELILHGPQDSKDAIQQNTIDDMFADTGAEDPNQDDIDAMFD